MKRKIIFLLSLIALSANIMLAQDANFAEPNAPLGSNTATVYTDSGPVVVGDKVTLEDNITTKPAASNIIEKSAKSPYANSLEGIVAQPSSELVKMAIMFLKVMFAVVVCSVIIYFLLLFVQKFYGERLPKNAKVDDFSDNLKSSQNENDALKTFLNKTRD